MKFCNSEHTLPAASSSTQHIHRYTRYQCTGWALAFALAKAAKAAQLAGEASNTSEEDGLESEGGDDNE